MVLDREAVKNEDEYFRQHHAEKRAHSQDVYLCYKDVLDRGPLNPKRRERAENDFEYFCKTYGADAFSLPWADFHYKAADRIQSAVWHGGMFAFAFPRGSGKTTFCHYAVEWAWLCGWSPYTVFIGATAHDAKRRLDNLKASIRFNELLFEDFPEVVCPIRHLEGEARKASGQKWKGRSSGIQWTQNQIISAAVDVPYAKSSEAVIDVTGIEGSLRGRNYQKQDGTIVRPTFVICDDPQTRESAKSVSQCEHREAVLSGDTKYMAGPDRPLGVVMPCTVIFENDMADRLLNRKQHPEWQGERVKFVDSFPTNDQLWEQYAEIRADEFRHGGKGEAANKFYQDNRAEMDDGATVTWEHRKFPDEISAIQHAMNQKLRDELAFMAEYQNAPLTAAENEIVLPKAEDLAEHTNGVPRQTVPDECELLTAFIDISEKALWWMVCAWSRDFTGAVIDYGVYPEQGLNYVTLKTLKRSLQDLSPDAGLEGSIYAGLERLTESILGREYMAENGKTPHRVKLCLVDSGWGATTSTVYRFCRRSPYSHILLPSKGVGITAARKPLVDPTVKRKSGESVQGQWKVAATSGAGVMLTQYCTNHWKTFVLNRLLVAKGDVGALTLFQDKPYAHRMVSEQLTAERCVRTEGHGRVVDQWDLIPGRDNHLFDALIGCAVAASVNGASVKDSALAPRRSRQPTDGQPQRRVKKSKPIYM